MSPLNGCCCHAAMLPCCHDDVEQIRMTLALTGSTTSIAQCKGRFNLGFDCTDSMTRLPVDTFICTSTVNQLSYLSAFLRLPACLSPRSAQPRILASFYGCHPSIKHKHLLTYRGSTFPLVSRGRGFRGWVVGGFENSRPASRCG